MTWRELSYTKKGIIIGLIITFLFILIPSYCAPNHNYTQRKNQYEVRNLIVKNCGESPSTECLTKLCDYHYTYPEAFGNFCRCDKFTGNATKNSCIWSVEDNTLWRQYTRTDKPNITVLLMPNIKDGLEAFGMFGIFGLIILVLPLFLGLVIGKTIDRAKIK